MRFLASVVFIVCATGVQASDCEQGANLLAEAQNAYAEVVEIGFAWKTTEDYLEDAQKAEMEGDCKALNEHALRALNTAKAAMEQSRVEQDAWRNRVPKG